MTTTIELRSVLCGTELNIVQEHPRHASRRIRASLSEAPTGFQATFGSSAWLRVGSPEYKGLTDFGPERRSAIS